MMCFKLLSTTLVCFEQRASRTVHPDESATVFVVEPGVHGTDNTLGVEIGAELECGGSATSSM